MIVEPVKVFPPVPEVFHHLPNPAKCAIDELAAQGYGHRTLEKLDKYLEHFFRIMGQTCTAYIRYSCHVIAVKRFSLEEPISQSVINDAIRFRGGH